MESKQVLIQKLSKEQLEEMGVFSWPIWEKQPSEFDWYYDMQERCYFLEGEVIVKTDQDEYHIQAGDFVTFPRGLACTWKILKKVRKHYSFD